MLYDRDLSWLGFNHRVLQEAKDPNIPLYERLKFLAIFSSNLDEFFRVRYPTVVAFSKLDKKKIGKKSLLNEDIADTVQLIIHDHLNEFGQTLEKDIIPALKEKKVYFYYDEPLLPQHGEEIKEIFLSRVLSFIQPIFLGPDTPFRFLPHNNDLYLVVTLENDQKDTVRHVVINIPSGKLARFFVLSPLEGMTYVIFIDDVIRENIKQIFPGQHILSVYSFKFNRDAELDFKNQYSNNLLDKIEKQLSARESGEASRFLYGKGMPANLQFFLGSLFNVELEDMFEGGRYHNLSDLFSFPCFDPSLKNPREHPILYPPSTTNGDIFNCIMRQNILLHLPYHSYTPVLTFFNQAAVDPDVTDIFITLYRVAAESHIVNALISAAKNGKKVTAFIELKARFDEANNIKWSRVMKKAGVNLIYSDADIKVHSKIALVKRKSGKDTLTYAVLCTGNFNENTAAFYTDHVLMTTDENVCSELMQLFAFLQKKHQSIDKSGIVFNELYVSRFNLINDFEKLINAEIKKAKKGIPALIRVKVNNLEEPYFIDLLYKASSAGVEIRLIVRSICCLVPGVKDMSENIIVKRIVDKYLEHTRIFIFGNDEAGIVAMGSSDLMTRNLHRRIEVCINVKDTQCRKQLIDYFDIQWKDNTKAITLSDNREEERLYQQGEQHNAQTEIFNYLKALPV